MTRFVFFQAHPDDLEVNCAHLLHYVAAHSDKHDVRIVSVTKGEFGLPGARYDKYKGDFLAGIRTKELFNAAALHGIQPDSIDFLGYVDGFVEFNKRFVDHIVRYLQDHRPDVIIAPEALHTWYYHMDHVNTGRALFYTLHHQLVDFSPRLYFYTSLNPNSFLKIPKEQVGLTDQLIACHKTQWWLMKWMRYTVKPIEMLSGLIARGWRYAEPYRRVFYGMHSREKNRAGLLVRVFTHFFSGLPFFQAKYPQAILEKKRSERTVSR